MCLLIYVKLRSGYTRYEHTEKLSYPVERMRSVGGIIPGQIQSEERSEIEKHFFFLPRAREDEKVYQINALQVYSYPATSSLV